MPTVVNTQVDWLARISGRGIRVRRAEQSRAEQSRAEQSRAERLDSIFSRKVMWKENSVWTLADCEWRAATPGLKPFRLLRAPQAPYHSHSQPPNIVPKSSTSHPPKHKHSRQSGALSTKLKADRENKRGRGKPMNDLVVRKSGLPPTKQK